MDRYITLADFWYRTDYANFKLQFDSITEAIESAKRCIDSNLNRTIEILKQDASEIDNETFTAETEVIINIISQKAF